jgi:hypothetical protein
MTDHEPFEDRLRETLRAGDPSVDRPDVEGFLMDVHSGARSRRRRRTTAMVAAATVVVAGAVGAGSLGVFTDDQQPIADSPTLTTADTSDATSSSAPMTGTGAGQTIPYTRANTRIVSLTSTGNEHQWVLTKTETPLCAQDVGGPCTTIFARGSAGDWGEYALVAPGDDISELRFVQDADGGYDAWAYGPSRVLSIHRLGAPAVAMAWHSVDLGGQVVGLEAHGKTVYALAVFGGTSTLTESPTSTDDFQPVDTGAVGEASNLVATAGVVAFIDKTDTGAEVLSSPADPESGRVTGGWSRSQPCPAGSQPVSLSSASDTLWALCSDGSFDTVSLRPSGSDMWTQVPSYQTGLGSLLTARSTDSAVLQLADNTKLMLVTPAGATPLTDGSPGFSNPTMLGFTNQDLGFAIANGDLWRTEDGGKSWAQEQVIPAG